MLEKIPAAESDPSVGASPHSRGKKGARLEFPTRPATAVGDARGACGAWSQGGARLQPPRPSLKACQSVDHHGAGGPRGEGRVLNASFVYGGVMGFAGAGLTRWVVVRTRERVPNKAHDRMTADEGLGVSGLLPFFSPNVVGGRGGLEVCPRHFLVSDATHPNVTSDDVIDVRSDSSCCRAVESLSYLAPHVGTHRSALSKPRARAYSRASTVRFALVYFVGVLR